jgi:hypothetical protein
MNDYEITKEDITGLIDTIKTAGYYDPDDCRKAVIEFKSLCGTNAIVFDILDLALKELSIKANNEKITYHFVKEEREIPKEQLQFVTGVL